MKKYIYSTLLYTFFLFSCQDSYKPIKELKISSDTLFINENEKNYSVKSLITIRRNKNNKVNIMLKDVKPYISTFDIEEHIRAPMCDRKSKEEVLFIDTVSCKIEANFRFFVDEKFIKIIGDDYDLCVNKQAANQYYLLITLVYQATKETSLISDNGGYDHISIKIPVVDEAYTNVRKLK